MPSTTDNMSIEGPNSKKLEDGPIDANRVSLGTHAPRILARIQLS